MLNLPLLIAAWFILKRRYVIYTILFTILSFLWVYVLGEVHFYQYIVETDKVIVAIFSGLLLGAITEIMLRIGASSGGIDIIACIVQDKFNRDVEKVISFVCYIKSAYSTIIGAFGKVDILINGAGGKQPESRLRQRNHVARNA